MTSTTRPIKRRYNNTRDIQGDLLKALAKQLRKGRDGATVRELQDLIGAPTVSETAIRDNLKVMARDRSQWSPAWVGKLDIGPTGSRWAITDEGERVAISRGYIRERRATNETVALPITPCSVVWSNGHPWVLDGEPGISSALAPRRWIGLDDTGSPQVRTRAEMLAAGFSIVYIDTDGDKLPAR